MKKTLLVFGLVSLLFSCKKDDTTNDFKATDLTGTTIVKGNITRNISTGTVAARGVTVTVKVNNRILYPKLFGPLFTTIK